MITPEPAKLSPAQETIRRIFLDQVDQFHAAQRRTKHRPSLQNACAACDDQIEPLSLTLIHAWRYAMIEAHARHPGHDFAHAQFNAIALVMTAAMRAFLAVQPASKRERRFAELHLALRDAMDHAAAVARSCERSS